MDIVKATSVADALFVAYHGVLVPPVTPRYRATPDLTILELLSLLRRKMRVIVVSTRSCSALSKIAGSVDALICCNGCETHLPDLIVVPRAVHSYAHVVLDIARKLENAEMFTVELRRTSFGDAVGLAIEWGGDLSKGDRENLELAIKLAIDNGLRVYSEPKAGFVEVYAPHCSRARAVEIVKRLLDIKLAAYLGESMLDNEAFSEVEIPIAVRHEFNRDVQLNAHYDITREQLITLLRNLVSS